MTRTPAIRLRQIDNGTIKPRREPRQANGTGRNRDKDKQCQPEDDFRQIGQHPWRQAQRRQTTALEKAAENPVYMVAGAICSRAQQTRRAFSRIADTSSIKRSTAMETQIERYTRRRVLHDNSNPGAATNLRA